MTDPGHVGTADVAPPPFIPLDRNQGRGYWGGFAPFSWLGRGYPLLLAWRPLDLEPVCFRLVGDPFAKLCGRGSQCPGEFDDRRQSRLPAGALEQRDLGPMEVAEIPQLFL